MARTKAKGGISVKITGTGALEIAADLAVLPVFEGELKGSAAPLVKALDAALEGHLGALAKAERFEGKADQQLSVPTLGRLAARRVLLLGMGPRAKARDGWAQDGFEALRLAAGKAARAATAAGAESVVFALPELANGATAGAARAAVEGVLLGTYRFARYKREDEARKRNGVATLQLALAGGGKRDARLEDEVELGRAIAAAVAWARDLVNEPPMTCTPAFLAQQAQQLAKDAGLTVEVRGPKEIAALKMGMFLAVTRGSIEEPRLVKLSWIPKGAAAKKAPVVLVGKAITFDSGGLSLKPTDGMVHMNTDMAGSAAVLGAMRVIATLAPPFPVHALLGACENMPGGRAYKPSDILTAYDGKTVEITNTDAEGRLVLGDVLAWAADTLGPAALVDVATLTGACVVALGPTTAGLMGPDGPVVEGLLGAARAAGEEVWRLPLVESLKEQLKSDRAELKNTGDRQGGAISAGHFLHAFVKDAPWAHLDIAGPSHSGKERGYVPKGGTGFGIRTLVEFVRAWRG
jgi:leucyl aminopeptidase